MIRKKLFARLFAPSNKAVFSERERGFLEGLIDGEGSLTLRISENWFCPEVSICNTSFSLIEKARNIINENINIVPAKGRLFTEKKRKQLYVVSVRAVNQIINLLTQINLIAKSEQQKLLLNACSLIKDKPENYLNQLNEIRLKIMQLNSWGGKARIRKPKV
jgi:hypothetical protein